jgi:hypothetical protein
LGFPIWLNRMLMREQWDLIINVGHVVPHEVLGSPTTTRTTSSAWGARN